ncbi:efflux RND transporter periplasmic adaptor subunit [Fusobacterium sp. MFO224]|uniref:efflux RND transporter periplasmic adaptor subunit n=1 Tax=Fusobacterium sp. MFO224 TaxID=3378070 RepID=UPI0038526EC0
MFNLTKKKIIIIAGIVLVSGGLFLKVDPFNATQVKVENVRVGALSNEGMYSGTVIPGKLVPVFIEAPAVVESVMAVQGEEVEEGTELMVFSNKSLLENEKQLKINALDVQDAELRIADLNSGTLKLELDNKQLEIKSLEQSIKNESKKLPVVEKQAKTYEKLLAQDGVSSIEANQKLMEYEELKTKLDLNKQKYSLMTVSYESLRRQLNIDEAKIKSELSKLKLQRETLQIREEQLKDPLKSPVSGIVVNVDVMEGSVISPGERLVAIAAKGENRVILEVPSYEAETLAKGQKAKIITRDSSGDNTYVGYVDKVSSAAVSSAKGNNKVVSVEIAVTGENNLKPGFIADVQISKKEKADVPVVNNFSVLEEGGKYFVYVIENGLAKKREVQIGARSLNNYEVLDLPVGTQVIVNPFKVKAGEKVKVVK